MRRGNNRGTGFLAFASAGPVFLTEYKLKRCDEGASVMTDYVSPKELLQKAVQLAKKNTTVARRYIGIGFDHATHARKLLRRHDHKKLIFRLRKNDEFFGVIAAPAGWDGDAIFVIDGMTEFAGVEVLG